MKELLSAQELQKYNISKEELLSRFLDQLYKDFEMASLSEFLTASRESLAEDLPSSLAIPLEKVAAAGKMQTLLYRIDITEQQYGTVLQQQNEMPYMQLAELVIKRVLQKVIFKLVYSR